MTRRRFAIAIGIVFFTLFAVVAALAVNLNSYRPTSEQLAKQPSVGSLAPTFSLRSMDGVTLDGSSVNEQGPLAIIVLRGWVGYQCPICSEQVWAFLSLGDAFTKAGLRVAFVYPGASGNLTKHADAFKDGITLPKGFFFALDPDMQFVNAWGLTWSTLMDNTYPAAYVVGRDGKVLYAKVSKNRGDRATPQDLLAAVAAK